MVQNLFQGNDEMTIRGGDLPRIIPFEIGSCPIPDIHGFPEWIVAWEESSIRGVEFVRKDQFVVVSVESGSRLCRIRRFGVDQLREVRSTFPISKPLYSTAMQRGSYSQVGSLTGAVNPDVTSDESLDGIAPEEMENWVKGEEHDDACRDEQ